MKQDVKQLLNWGVNTLKPVLGSDASTDARVLLANVLEMDRGLLGARMQMAVTKQQNEKYEADIYKRLKRQPVSQIIGKREFWGRSFVINQDVLDPRPDTETLIEVALAGTKPNRILDLGTGSGCILLTLLAQWPDAIGQGVDKSKKALEIAKINAQNLGVSKRVDLFKSDWFSNVTGKFDLIVGNPPYISEKSMKLLAEDVRCWEPRIALTPEGDGLDAYREIALNGLSYLSADGLIVLEIGWDQTKAVAEIFKNAGFHNEITVQDLEGKDRVMVFSALKDT